MKACARIVCAQAYCCTNGFLKGVIRIMKAVRLHGLRDLRTHDEPVPQPMPGEVQIQVKSVGVCASDGHWYRDGRIGSTVLSAPLILGHEASGVIIAVGEDVSPERVGERIAIEPAKPCMKCEFCLAGHYNVCPNIPFFGTPPTDGCFCEYVCWPANLALKAPDCMSFDEIAMLEPMAVGVYAIDLSLMKSTDNILVMGAGAIGLSVIQAAKAHGAAQIIVSEPVKERRELAMKLGATDAVDPGSSDAVAVVHTLTNNRGVDIAFECTGAEQSTVDASRMVKVLGKVMVIGIPDEDFYHFDASSSRRKELTVVFVRRSNLTTERSMELVAEKKIDVASYATHRYTLDKVGEAMETMISKRDGVVRAVIAVSD